MPRLEAEALVPFALHRVAPTVRAPSEGRHRGRRLEITPELKPPHDELASGAGPTRSSGSGSSPPEPGGLARSTRGVVVATPSCIQIDPDPLLLAPPRSPRRPLRPPPRTLRRDVDHVDRPRHVGERARRRAHPGSIPPRLPARPPRVDRDHPVALLLEVLHREVARPVPVGRSHRPWRRCARARGCGGCRRRSRGA